MKALVYLFAAIVTLVLIYAGVVWSVESLNNMFLAGAVATVWGLACLVLSLNGARALVARGVPTQLGMK